MLTMTSCLRYSLDFPIADLPFWLAPFVVIGILWFHTLKFIPNFVRHHHAQQDRYLSPHAILFQRADDRVFELQCVQPICKLSTEESKFLHGNAATSYLDVIPSPVIIRASFDDLLLVAPGKCDAWDFYVCNPLTKWWEPLSSLSSWACIRVCRRQ